MPLVVLESTPGGSAATSSRPTPTLQAICALKQPTSPAEEPIAHVRNPRGGEPIEENSVVSRVFSLPRCFRVLGSSALPCLIFLYTLSALPAASQSTVTGGLGHTCVIAADGGVVCWGLNDSGQLGNGTTTDQINPQAVLGLPQEDIHRIASGEAFTCALTLSGGLYCWGDNLRGQLGNGTTDSSSVATPVTGLPLAVDSFATGTAHICAVTTSGELYCWGANPMGQLGDGTTTDRSTPTRVAGVSASTLIQSVTAGEDHSCAATSTGNALCWGDNFFGQIGDGTSRSRALPTRVYGLSTRGAPRLGLVDQITSGSRHSCARTTAGNLYCWGDNERGQLGNSLLQSQRLPALVSGITEPTEELYAGDAFTCARSSENTVWCWGANSDGQIGVGDPNDRSAPTAVTRLGNAALTLGTGLFHACSSSVNSQLSCWGDNFYAQLGNLPMDSSSIPVVTNVFSLIDLPTGPSVPVSFAARAALALSLCAVGAWLTRRATRGILPGAGT